MVIKTRLTRKQSIVECKKLWIDIELSGLSKHDYFREHYELRHKWYCDCPLCEWINNGKELNTFTEIIDDPCPPTNRVCPLIKQYRKTCYDLGFADSRGFELSREIPSKEWLDVIKGLEISEVKEK